MNYDTKVIVGDRRSGKSSELIRLSASKGIYILVSNKKRAHALAAQAREMGINIPFPVTLHEWLQSSTRFHGSVIRRDGLLIDDIDAVIRELFSPININAVTITTPCIKRLKSKKRHKKTIWESFRKRVVSILRGRKTN